jgi:O-antigen ligase
MVSNPAPRVAQSVREANITLLSTPVAEPDAVRPGRTRRAPRELFLVAAGLVLLVAAMEFKVRNRDPELALQGSVDGQVAAEMAVALAVGAALAGRRLVNDVRAARQAVPRVRLRRSSTLFMLRAVALVSLVSSVWSPTTVAPVRAVELLIMVELVAEVARLAQRGPEAADAFWRWVTRLMVVAVAGALGWTALAGNGFFDVDFTGYHRFRLLLMHPIASGDFMGATAVLVVWGLLTGGGLLAKRDRGGRAAELASWSAALALFVGVVLTHERGPLFATVIALGTVFVAGAPAARVRVGLLAAAAGALVVAAVAGQQLYSSVVLRGQSVSTLATFSGRNEIWAEAFHFFLARPVFGSGYLAGRSVYLSTIPWAGRSHNAFVEIAVSLGLAGLLLYGLLFWRWLRCARRGLASSHARSHRYAVLAAASAAFILLVGVIDDSFAGTPGLLTMMMCLGVLAADLAGVIPGRRPEGPDSRPTTSSSA